MHASPLSLPMPWRCIADKNASSVLSAWQTGAAATKVAVAARATAAALTPSMAFWCFRRSTRLRWFSFIVVFLLVNRDLADTVPGLGPGATAQSSPKHAGSQDVGGHENLRQRLRQWYCQLHGR